MAIDPAAEPRERATPALPDGWTMGVCPKNEIGSVALCPTERGCSVQQSNQTQGETKRKPSDAQRERVARKLGVPLGTQPDALEVSLRLAS